jgi:2-keto-4-pentenoate hydratase/2-oxohepta-3-ene-1,7-dioic acid hydratase in catechol pathway
LVIIIGKRGKDIPEEKALEYVLGYAVGNDVSHRGWQLQRGSGQWGTGKMFDGWAPISGAIVSPEVDFLRDYSDNRLSKIPIIFKLELNSMERLFKVPQQRI